MAAETPMTVTGASIMGVMRYKDDSIILNVRCAGSREFYDFLIFLTPDALPFSPDELRLGEMVSVRGAPYGLFNKAKQRYELAIRAHELTRQMPLESPAV